MHAFWGIKQKYGYSDFFRCYYQMGHSSFILLDVELNLATHRIVKF